MPFVYLEIQETTNDRFVFHGSLHVNHNHNLTDNIIVSTSRLILYVQPRKYAIGNYSLYKLA